MNEAIEQLKPCPFCGRPAFLEDEIVCCSGGEACVVGGVSKRPLDDWNKRPLEDALLVRAEKAEADLARFKQEADEWRKMADKLANLIHIEVPVCDDLADEKVKNLGELIGFGALMASASRQWNETVRGGAFTIGDCYATSAVILESYRALALRYPRAHKKEKEVKVYYEH